MKLLFDQNLSHPLVQMLADLYPGSEHVRTVGLARADDEAVWRYAGQSGFAIVTKDSDFHQRSFLLGHPPRRERQNDLATFAHDKDVSLLVLT